MRRSLYIISTILLLAGCSVTKPITKSQTYAEIYREKPVSILVMPPINRTNKVEAKELFYSSLAVPLTQKGYYVMPPLLTMDILKEESAYDSERFIKNSVKKFGEVFGVNAVLFTTISEWRKSPLSSDVEVKIEYLLKSTKTDKILFDRTGDVTLDTSVNSGNAIVNLIGGMLSTALTREIVVGRNCNIYVLDDIPAGKYSPKSGQDGGEKAGPKSFKANI